MHRDTTIFVREISIGFFLGFPLENPIGKERDERLFSYESLLLRNENHNNRSKLFVIFIPDPLFLVKGAINKDKSKRSKINEGGRCKIVPDIFNISCGQKISHSFFPSKIKV